MLNEEYIWADTHKEDKKNYRPWRKDETPNLCTSCSIPLRLNEQGFCNVCQVKLDEGYDLW